jgi:hypothetical protein
MRRLTNTEVTMDIQLNFINRSHDQNNSRVFLFQKNAATQMDELTTAWKVIRNCGYNCNHPLVYSTSFETCIHDQYGNRSPRRAVQAGDLLSVSSLPNGRSFTSAGKNNNSREFAIRNDLVRGAIDVGVYSNGKLLALKTNVVPGQKAVFEMLPTLWIGVAAQVIEGQALDSAILSNVNTELSLLGIARADIVMTGGGVGRECAPLQFSLENVAMA